jgi:hypothetical protein
MITKNILILTAAIATLSCQAQTTQKRDIKNFDKIEASGAASIYYENSPTFALSVEGDAGEIKNIETTVKDNVLYIKTKGDFNHPFKIKVSGNNLKHIGLTGACYFNGSGEIKSDLLTIESTGASKIEMQLSAKSVKAKLTGASSANLTGTTQDLSCNITGASNLKAYDLKSVNTTVNASGASMAQVYASQKLHSASTGASSIKYKGEPKDISQTTSTN